MTDETRTEETPAGTTTLTPETETPAEKKPGKLNQEVEIRDIGPCKKHIKVSISPEDVGSRMGAKFSEMVGDANVAGFRPGKAPRKVIERRFHKDVSDQVKGEVMMQSLEQLAEDHDIAPLSPPDLDPAKIVMPKDGPLVYEFDVEVRPQFDLPDYKGLKLRRPIHTFSDTEISEEEQRVLARYGQIVPKPEGNAQVGDYIVADVKASADGKALAELKETRFHVERRVAFKDGIAERFAEQVKGANVGDARTVEVTLSQSAADPALQGQKVQATLEVKEVKTVRLPDMTPEFLTRFGVHSLEQLHERVRVALERRLEYVQRQLARKQVLDRIAEAATWDLPRDLLAKQARVALGRRIMEMRAGGMSDEEITGQRRVLEQDVLRSTAVALKEHFVLQKIAEVEKISLSDDDINSEIERIAFEANESPRRIRARLEKEELLEPLAVELIERKVLDLVLQNAEYEDYPYPYEEAESRISVVEEQLVSGEMQDQTAVEETKEES